MVKEQRIYFVHSNCMLYSYILLLCTYSTELYVSVHCTLQFTIPEFTICYVYVALHCILQYTVHQSTLYMQYTVHYSTLYTTVHCTLKYSGHCSTLYTAVHCTLHYTLNCCTLYTAVHCTLQYTVQFTLCRHPCCQRSCTLRTLQT